MGDTVAAVRGTLRERALDAIERYRSEHPNAPISSACTALAGELGSTPASVSEAYYMAKRQANGSSSSSSSTRKRPAVSSSSPVDVPAILRRAAEQIDA